MIAVMLVMIIDIIVVGTAVVVFDVSNVDVIEMMIRRWMTRIRTRFVIVSAVVATAQMILAILTLYL